MLKLGIHMDNELLYCGIENLTPCSYSSLYLSIFVSPAKQKRDICTAFPAASSSSSSAASSAA